MGASKTELYKSEILELANLFKAMAHPARVSILQHLLQANQCITNDLVNEIGLAQATITQHLKELKKVGLIKGTVEGTAVCYCIDAPTWNRHSQMLNEFFSRFSLDKQCC